MNRVYIKTYGCQMNERDSEAVAEMLRSRGYTIVDDEFDADIILINTCSVREQAEQKAIGKTMRLLPRRSRDGSILPPAAFPQGGRRIVGIMGCMAQNRGRDLLDRLPDLDLLVGTQKFHRVPEMLEQLVATQRGLGPEPHTLVALDEEAGSQNAIKDHVPGRKISAFVSIMQGCDMRCSYCIVPKTRGRERARPIDDIVGEVEDLVKNHGTREVMLLGQIVNRYGLREFPTVDGKTPFVQLLERLSAIEGLWRIRFTSPHPSGFREDLVNAYRYLPKLCSYIHFPAQSGSNMILKAMRRPYTRERYMQLINDLRAARPDMFFSTDVIVGFPGETEEDFELTKSLFHEARFDMAYIFRYSVRKGAPAEILGDPVPEAEKDRRDKELLAILEGYSIARNRALIGSVQEVLVEGRAKRGERMYQGRNNGDRRVIFEGDDSLIGALVKVKIESVTVTALTGTLTETIKR
ncbi:MAG: tRNA (N6-isopentenyl adenosine(37)-C2)-methylthiotransferase MiaB [Opitutales bacterium]|nr:tRNA (N6-isopentenyl adenosine(37)-C2)-methylthiotransferase MiaB [Opitutales bacterium]